MATEKLAEGIRGFAADTEKLELMVDKLLKEYKAWFINFKYLFIFKLDFNYLNLIHKVYKWFF